MRVDEGAWEYMRVDESAWELMRVDESASSSHLINDLNDNFSALGKNITHLIVQAAVSPVFNILKLPNQVKWKNKLNVNETFDFYLIKIFLWTLWMGSPFALQVKRVPPYRKN